jgi:anion-transporting  ArsA/GET3 family ATPase
LPEQLIDTEMADKKDLKHLEESLQILWDKARRVSEVILKLKAENKELQSRISGLELSERRSMEELRRRENDLNEIRAELAKAQSNGSSLFSKEESEVLKSRLKELILKINSRV